MTPTGTPKTGGEYEKRVHWEIDGTGGVAYEDELHLFSVSDLRIIAKGHGLHGYSKMNKAELINLLMTVAS